MVGQRLAGEHGHGGLGRQGADRHGRPRRHDRGHGARRGYLRRARAAGPDGRGAGGGRLSARNRNMGQPPADNRG